MHVYQSHKIVEAAPFVRCSTVAPNGPMGWYVFYENDDGGEQCKEVAPDVHDRLLAASRSDEDDNGYLVSYEDGYLSWSPSKAFEEGYNLVQPSSGKSKIAGYRELNATELVQMNNIKEHGKQLGAVIDYMRSQPDYDQRWVSIGATDLQTGLMALTRAVAKPDFF